MKIIYKEINSELVDTFLGHPVTGKFRYTDENGTTYIPTYNGLKDIVNNTNDATGEREITSTALYYRLLEAAANKGEITRKVKIKDILSWYWDDTEIEVKVNPVPVFEALIGKGPADLEKRLQNMKISLTISTCPYWADKAAGYGNKAKPTALSAIEGAKNPIIFWGFDVWGPNNETKPTPQTPTNGN